MNGSRRYVLSGLIIFSLSSPLSHISWRYNVTGRSLFAPSITRNLPPPFLGTGTVIVWPTDRRTTATETTTGPPEGRDQARMTSINTGVIAKALPNGLPSLPRPGAARSTRATPWTAMSETTRPIPPSTGTDSRVVKLLNSTSGPGIITGGS